MEEFGVEKVVASAAWVFVICRWKAPTTIFFRVWLHDAHGQKFLQALQFPHDDSSMRKRAEEADVEVVAVRVDREGRSAKAVAPGPVIGWRMIGHDIIVE